MSNFCKILSKNQKIVMWNPLYALIWIILVIIFYSIVYNSNKNGKWRKKSMHFIYRRVCRIPLAWSFKLLFRNLYEKGFEDMHFVLKKLLINKVDDEWAVPVTPGSCHDICRYQANATTVEKDPKMHPKA